MTAAPGFPWRAIWRWLTAPRISWLTFVAIIVVSSIFRAVLGW